MKKYGFTIQEFAIQTNSTERQIRSAIERGEIYGAKVKNEFRILADINPDFKRKWSDEVYIELSKFPFYSYFPMAHIDTFKDWTPAEPADVDFLLYEDEAFATDDLIKGQTTMHGLDNLFGLLTLVNCLKVLRHKTDKNDSRVEKITKALDVFIETLQDQRIQLENYYK